MGAYDRSICDCCVCPMKCILEQLIGEESVFIVTDKTALTGTLLEVKDFIAFLEMAPDSINRYPMNQIFAVFIEGQFDFKIKPIRKDIGECSCTEEPTTRLANNLVNETVDIIAGAAAVTGKITKVGEGIVIFSFEEGGDPFTGAFSSCKIELIGDDIV
ncbi:hypothetical protein [Chengkuizengella marina]|nr:hypothetical protein [Chengkuizengella marina]